VPEWDAELEVDEDLARRLIGRRFPTLDPGSLRRVGEGWDNVVWATRDGVAFRFPRREIAVPGVEREIVVLPHLAARLPLEIPDAAYPAEPDRDFRWPWFGSRLIPGREIASARLGDAERTAIAPRLGHFLRTLHRVTLDCDATLPIDPHGRTDMTARVPSTRAALSRVQPLWTAPVEAHEILEEAERLPPPSATAIVHGDLHVRHLLLDATGTLVGVIDWGDVCRADPAADLSLFWSLLPPAGRDAFLGSYGPVAADALLRARVLALFLSATLATYARATGNPDLEREAVSGLERTLVR
jgi:aminoglycoside phosphotransferase (APT) family kinase protein